MHVLFGSFTLDYVLIKSKFFYLTRMKLVLYCSNSVWSMVRKMHKKQIFLVGADSVLPAYAGEENAERVKEMNFWEFSLKKDQRQGQNINLKN